MNLHRIEIPILSSFESVNIYMIVEADGLTMIDAGKKIPGAWESFLEKMKSLNLSVKNIKQLILTHDHVDHIGFISEVLEHSDAEILMPTRVKKWITHPEEMTNRRIIFLTDFLNCCGIPNEIEGQLVQLMEILESSREAISTHRINTFEHGDNLAINDKPWEIIYTPGHSDAQYCFFQKEKSQIFGSDMLLPIAPVPMLSESPDDALRRIKSLPQMITSFQEIKKLNIQKVFPGHGVAFQDANVKIEKQLNRIHQRKEECLEWVKKGVNTIFDLTLKMYPLFKGLPNLPGLCMVVGYLDLLVEEGKIKEKIEADRTFIYFPIG